MMIFNGVVLPLCAIYLWNAVLNFSCLGSKVCVRKQLGQKTMIIFRRHWTQTKKLLIREEDSLQSQKNEVIGTTHRSKRLLKYSHGNEKLITLYMLIEVMSNVFFSTNQIWDATVLEKWVGGKHQHSFLHTSTFKLYSHK